MSEWPIAFGENRVALGYDLEQRLAEFDQLRFAMVRNIPDVFTRDEWAYLLTFIEPSSLRHTFTNTFGERGEGPPSVLYRPRGPIAVWLPNNVSLLGPLLLIQCCLVGTEVRMKAGSQSADLCTAFVQFALTHLPAGPLREYLACHVVIEQFDRNDRRNDDLAQAAAVRIAFGSDATTQSILSRPHPAGSTGIAFGDHRSEAWVQATALTDAHVVTLIKVFTIYGQAGCTSPRRVVVIGDDPSDAEELRDRMLTLWPKQDVPMHVASDCLLHSQLARLAGWQVRLAPRHAALLGVGSIAQPELAGMHSLALVSASAQEAADALPGNIQTVGHCVEDAGAPHWLDLLSRTSIKRWVPLSRMHHFGPLWDGMHYWRQMFEAVEVAT